MKPKTGGVCVKYLSVLFMILCAVTKPAKAQLTADFSADKIGGCSPLTVQFNNLTRGASANAAFFWDMGNGNTSVNRNISATFLTEKTYTVSLTVTDGAARSVKTMQIVVSRKPTADFDISAPHGCIPFSPVITSKSTTPDGTLTSFVWEFGDGTTQTTTSPSVAHTYTTPMKPVITLTAVNNYGCGAIVQKQGLTDVLPALTAGFTPDKTILCKVEDPISFTNTSTGPGNLTYQWNFGDGQTSTVKNATHVYGKAGEYSATLTTKNDKGCSHSFTLPGLINVAAYKLDVVVPTLLCTNPGYHSFSATTYPNTYNIQWEFSNGANYYGSNYVSQNITTAGDYSVKVKATLGTCPVEVNRNFKVNASPVLTDFDITDPPQCGTPAALKLKDNSTWATKWSWSVSSYYTSTIYPPATQSTSVNIVRDDYYYISLLATDANGCSAATSKQISVYKPVVTIQNANSTSTDGSLVSCGAFKADFSATTNLGTIKSWKWDAGNAGKSTAENPSFSFNTAGSYTVSLEYETSLGCKGTTSVTAVVNMGPTIGITGPQSVCGDNNVTYNSTGTTGGVNASYYWSFTKTYGGSGGFSSYLTGTSTTGRFTDTGWYNVQLRVYNNGSVNYCSNERTINKYVQVLPPFKGEISITNNCTDNKGELTFVEYSRYAEKWEWNFGDNETMTYTKATKPAEVKHVYKNSGRYLVSLTITAGSCSFTVTKDAIVLLDPLIRFTNDATVCGNRYAAFRSTGSDIVSSYSWSFNSTTSGATAVGGAPSVSFSDTGWYSGKLRLHVNNCTYEGTEQLKVIKVLPPYPGVIYPQLTCNEKRGEVLFTENSKGAEKWEWDFGDGGKASYTLPKQVIVKHTYTRTGSYNVALKVTTGSCVFDMSTTVKVLIQQHPQLSAIQTAVCVDDPLKITLQGLEKNPLSQFPLVSDYGTPQVQYEDGSFFTGNQESTVPRQYPYTPGTWETVYTANLHSLSRDRKQIRLITAPYGFWDYNNCPDTSNYVTIRIDGPTTVLKITKNNVCNKQPVVFEDLSTVPAGNTIVNRRWNFGDGQTQTGASIPNPIEHYYPNLGSYPVSLTVTDNNGCNATTTATAVMSGPRAAFTISPTPATNKNTVYFYNNTWDLASGTQYEWSFSYDGLKTTDYSPVPRTYPKGGPATDKIMLIAYNSNSGCRDTAIQYLPVVNVNNAFTMNKRLLDGGCAPALVQFTNISYNYNNFKWDFGDGTILEDPYGSIRTPGHIYEKPGTYKVTLYGIGIGNSKDTTVDSVIIKPLAFASNVKASIREACTLQPVNLNADIKNNADITWDYGDGILAKANSSNITYVYSSGGIFRPAITVKNEDGCPAAAELNYEILIDSLNLKLNPQPSKICDAATVNFNPVVKNLGVERLGRSLTYSWNFDMPGTPGNTSTQPNPTFYYNKIGSYKPSLRVQSAAGCDQTVLTDIRVIKTPVLDLTAPAEACAQTDISFLGNSDPETGVNFTWDFKNGQTSNALLPAKVNYKTPGNYRVEFKADNDGCIRIIDHPIIIHKLPAVNPLRDTTLVFGSPLPLHASGSSDIVKWSWSPPSNLDCANCAVTIAQPKASGRYEVTAYNQHGCTASTGINVKLVCAETPIFIPNTFTPNKDGRNDLFYPRGKGVKIVKYFRIYNRLGEMIFERRDFALNDPAQGWNGTYMGRPLTNSVFTYASEMICDAGEAFTLKGTIMLMH